MLVLGIETSTRLGSVGVVRVPEGSGGDDVVLAEVSRDTGLRHGAALPGLVDEALDAAGRDLAAVDVVAVAVGPGSFTGLRVALATAKGFVLGTPTRLVGVPTLEALARAALGRLRAADPAAIPTGTLLAPCLDARRGEVYGACFAVAAGAGPDAGAGLREVEPAGAFAPSAFGRILADRAAGAPVIVFGEGAQRHRADIEAAVGPVARVLDDAAGAPSGAAVARIGARLGGSPGDAAGLAPVYVRASDAERNRASSNRTAGEAAARSR